MQTSNYDNKYQYPIICPICRLPDQFDQGRNYCRRCARIERPTTNQQTPYLAITITGVVAFIFGLSLAFGIQLSSKLASKEVNNNKNLTDYGQVTNLCYHKPVQASGSSCQPTEIPENAVNDSFSGGYGDKWCSSTAGDKWLQVDLGTTQTVSRWVVYHTEAGREPSQWNTRDFQLQSSQDGQHWQTVDTVQGNLLAVTDRIISPVQARYFRLYITQAGDDNVARIYDFQLYQR